MNMKIWNQTGNQKKGRISQGEKIEKISLKV